MCHRLWVDRLKRGGNQCVECVGSNAPDRRPGACGFGAILRARLREAKAHNVPTLPDHQAACGDHDERDKSRAANRSHRRLRAHRLCDARAQKGCEGQRYRLDLQAGAHERMHADQSCDAGNDARHGPICLPCDCAFQGLIGEKRNARDQQAPEEKAEVLEHFEIGVVRHHPLGVHAERAVAVELENIGECAVAESKSG